MSVLVVCSSCNNVKYLQEGQELYTGAKIKLESEENIPNEGSLKTELEGVLAPEPNSTFLGMRIKLWFYNIAGNPKYKRLACWIKTKLGEPPVLYKDVSNEKNTKLITNRLYNHGYFLSRVEQEVERKRERRVSVVYTAYLHKPYVLRNISVPASDTDNVLQNLIGNTMENTLLKKGEQYNLQTLKDERTRIDEVLKGVGYFFFSPDYLIFKADTTVTGKEVDIRLLVKEETPEKAARQYQVNNIYIYPDFSLGEDTVNREMDTVVEDEFHIISNENQFRNKVLMRSVFLGKGDPYDQEKHSQTLNRLMSLGTFKFVNIKFREVDTAGKIGKLNMHIYLTPLPKKSLRAELEAVAKSNDFAGPGLNLSFRNRNLLKGAELFVLDFSSGFETQIKGDGSGSFSYNIGAGADLFVPRFIVPFLDVTTNSKYNPKTQFKLGAELLNRVNYFNMSSFNFTYGYIWKTRPWRHHELNPVSIDYVRLNSTTESFDSILNSNELFRLSFDNQFIVGSNYSFTYNEQQMPRIKHPAFFKATIDVSGNLLFAGKYAATGESSTIEEPYTIFGQPFSQYLRGDIDIRKYLTVEDDIRWAGRLLAGLGYPLGNSATLPYVKQFFIGGSNSVRAFQARGLGPGSYIPPDSVRTRGFFDQTGDVLLEANLEYRFPMFSVFRGALFVDAGNIWMLPKDTLNTRPEGEFALDSFYRQIALGAGAGLRIDATFFILRFDLAFPLRKPVRETPGGPTQFAWFPDKIALQNFVLNIAIGYPF